MEGVGARLGRSSTRYGPATVFNGPVRKWKKKWVHVSPSAASSNSNNSHPHPHPHPQNGTSNGNNGSHLVLYKWTPITQSQNNNNNNNNGNTNTNNNNGDSSSSKEETAVGAAPEEPPRRKFKYVPIALLEEQKNEAAENEGADKVEDEAKPIDTDVSAAELSSKGEILDKPDINDVPMEESQSQEKNQVVRQDLNESTLDLSLGLTSHDDERDSDSKTNRMRDGQ